MDWITPLPDNVAGLFHLPLSDKRLKLIRRPLYRTFTTIPKFIVPLDCTNTVPLTKETYQQIADHQPSTIVTELYKQNFAPFFGSTPPPYVPYIYDTIALGCLMNPSFATDSRAIWLDIDTVTPSANTTFGSNYGKTIPYTSDTYSSIGVLAKSTVVFAINTNTFLRFYVDLLTRPVPVKFEGESDVADTHGD